MKLLFVIDSLGSGGAQRQVVNLAIGLGKRGHHVEFFLYYPQFNHFKNLLDKAKIVTHSIRKVGRFSFLPIIFLRNLYKFGKFDGVIAFLSTPSFYAEVAGLGLTNKPFLIVSERSVFTPRNFHWSDWLLQQFHRLADHITVNSNTQRINLLKKFPWMKSRLTTIYNGVDLDLFKPEAKNCNSKTISFLVIGTINRNKNPVGLVKALALVAEKFGNDCEIHWAGKVGSDCLAKAEFLRACKLIEELRLKDCWKWLGEVSDVAGLLQHYDALLHPSFYEGLPNAICEALACGKPILASNVCDNPYLVISGENGYLFNPEDPKSIESALLTFLNQDSQSKEMMGIKSRKIAESLISLEQYVSCYESKLFEIRK
ncbi:MAG: hypothetical protein C0412_02520 [Flavobacterium sp.]|nr:hypothetical protein [Flavobacterium sp.]